MDFHLAIEGEKNLYNPYTGQKNELKIDRAGIMIDHNMGDPSRDVFYIPIQLPDPTEYERNESGTWIGKNGFVGILTGLQFTSKYKDLFYHTYQCPVEEYDAARTKIYDIERAVYNFITRFGELDFSKDRVIGRATDIDAVAKAFEGIKTEEDFICEAYKNYSYATHEDVELRRDAFNISGEDCVDRFIAAALNYEKNRQKAEADSDDTNEK